MEVPVSPPAPELTADSPARADASHDVRASWSTWVAWGLLLATWGMLVLVRVSAGITGGAAAPAAATGFILPWFAAIACGVGGLALLHAALAGARAAAAAVPLVLAVTTWGCVWGRAMAPWPDRAEGAPLRVMTWNVQRLATIAGADSPACVAETVAGVAPDVVVLQEVSARELAPLERLGDLVCTQSTYFGSAKAWRGGVAVCVRGATLALGRAWPVRYDEESRWRYLVQEVTVARDGATRTFNVANVHLRPYLGTRAALGRGLRPLVGGFVRDAAEQSVQARELLEQVRSFRDPTVAAGDFNSVRDAPLHARMRGTMRDAWEVAGAGPGFTAWRGPRDALPFRIDYVYVSADFGVRAATVPDVRCSDHLPVVTDLVLRR